jgi:pantothenate kinase
MAIDSGGGGVTDDDDAAAAGIIYAPSFSHTLKDPTPDAILIHPHHRVVVIEGLYTFLRIPPWDVAARLLDERWFVDVDPAVARERLVRRHVVTGVARDRDEAEWRADSNDIPSTCCWFVCLIYLV